MAMASPPPMQTDAMPRLRPRERSACTKVTTMRALLEPMGWPTAQAPPSALTLLRGMASSRITAMGTTAKASFTSNRSTSSTDQPTWDNSARIAPMGAVVNHSGSWAWEVTPTMRARGVAAPRPFSLHRSKADAPSAMALDVAAVTVPVFPKAGFRAAYFSGLTRVGGSSVLMVVFPPLASVTVIGARSFANSPAASDCLKFWNVSKANAS
mmetsp:Transcript_51867/g.90504  ORF Transcript_51867/g.90504 Transcript_51867/m.90504 type:complete len:211 (-) Transcript_51867:597-1229(-)